MVTIITALRGNTALSTRWAKIITDRRIDAAIVAAVNNLDDERLVHEFSGVTVPVDAYRGDSEIDRVNHIAGIYAAMIERVKTPWVLMLDDDIVPPFRGFERLLETAKERLGPGIAGIVTVYPFNGEHDAEQAVLFWRPFDSGAALLSSVPATGIEKTWGGGTGFSIWRTDVLRKTLPWSTAEIEGAGVPGWDRDLAIKLADMKATTLVDCAIRCRHDSNEL